MRLVIEVEGGNVTEITASEECELTLIDYDNAKAPEWKGPWTQRPDHVGNQAIQEAMARGEVARRE